MISSSKSQTVSCSIVALALLAAACGDDDSGAAMCSAPVGCGGDLSGTWKVTSLCADISAMSLGSSNTGLPAQCTQTLVDALKGASLEPIDAQMAFANGQYSQTGHFRMHATYVFTRACLQAIAASSDGGTANALISTDSCNAMGQHLVPNLDSVTCAPNAGGCRCQISTTITASGSGPYRTSGSQIFLDQDTTGGAYCVHGQTASVYSSSSGNQQGFELMRGGSSAGDAGAVDSGL